MEELSIEQKAELYDESLKRAKEYHEDRLCVESTFHQPIIDVIEHIFPSLKESEDERIRKKIIESIRKDMTIGTSKDKKLALAWLEKQGEQKPANSEKTCRDKHNLDDIYPIFRVGDHIRNKKTGNKVLIEQLDVAAKAYCYVSYDGAAVIHSDFPFVKQDEWELIEQKGIGQNLAENSGKNSEYTTEEKNRDEYKEGYECGKQRVLKYPEDFGLCKKPADKVESKFKDGDWVVNNNGEPQLSQIISYSWPDSKIKRVTNNLEIFVNKATLDKQYHLWTFQDVKDGSVLCARNGGGYFKEYLFMFSSFTEDNVISTHFGYNVSNGTLDKKITRFGRREDFVSITPATKEQRDVLFAKLKEAGYRWNAEEKKLEKIEQKTTGWSKEDERKLSLLEALCDDQINGSSPYSTMYREIQELKVWLKFFRPRPKQISIWSEEDENRLKNLIELVNSSKENDPTKKGFINFINKLKSPRPQWKPSEEQLRELENVFSPDTDSWDENILRELHKQLKQL